MIPANSLMPSLHSSRYLNLHEVTFKDSYSPVRQSSLIDISLTKNASVDCIQYKIQDFPSLVENYWSIIPSKITGTTNYAIVITQKDINVFIAFQQMFRDNFRSALYSFTHINVARYTGIEGLTPFDGILATCLVALIHDDQSGFYNSWRSRGREGERYFARIDLHCWLGAISRNRKRSRGGVPHSFEKINGLGYMRRSLARDFPYWPICKLNEALVAFFFFETLNVNRLLRKSLR